MTAIYLIRHGQASFGQQNYDNLSPLGHHQAGVLGQELATRLGGFDQIHLGTMLRHQQTASACLANMPKDAQHDDTNWQQDASWNEYDHQDIMAQLGEQFTTAKGIEAYLRSQENPKQAFEKLFNQAMDRWLSGEFDDEYVESWQHYQQRIKAGLSRVVDQAKGAEKVAVFSSGGPISVVSQLLLGVEPNRVMQVNWTLVNCGVTKIISTPNRLFVSTLNDHSHFEGKDKALITYK